MPDLLINIVDGVWIAQIANVPDSAIRFVGENVTAQAMRVQVFAECMSNGQAVEACSMLEVELADLGEIAQTLFETTDALVFGATVVYRVVGLGATLMDELIAAGQALIDLLGIGV